VVTPFTAETLHWFVLAVVAGSYLILRRVTQSPFGMVLSVDPRDERGTRQSAIRSSVTRSWGDAVGLSPASPDRCCYASAEAFRAPDWSWSVANRPDSITAMIL